MNSSNVPPTVSLTFKPLSSSKKLTHSEPDRNRGGSFTRSFSIDSALNDHSSAPDEEAGFGRFLSG
jgi:hypothetical protein